MEQTIRIVQDASNGVSQAFQGLADAFSPLMDKLAGTQSDLKLSFEDFTLDTGTMRAKINGYLVLDVAYLKQTESKETAAEEEDSNVVSKTVVTNVKA